MTLTANNTSGIPVIGTPYALGETLAGIAGLEMRVFANTLRQTLPTANVIAEKTGVNDRAGGFLGTTFNLAPYLC